MEQFVEALKNGSVQMPQLDIALAEQARACSVQPIVGLLNAELWQEFHRHTNEMIITKAGRRMFPLIQLMLRELDSKATYYLLLALRVKDQSRWRFLNGEWVGSESGIRGVTSEAGPGEGYVYVHPLSPLSGEQWMKESPVSFSKLKLSNKDTEGGKAKLSSLHRYHPVAYLVKMPSQSPAKAEQGKQSLAGQEKAKPPPMEISEKELPETEFIAVTAYQNDLITQMKIKHNPFAKAFLPNQDKPTPISVQVDRPPTQQDHHPPGPPLLPAGNEQEAYHWTVGPMQQHTTPPVQYHHHYPYTGYYGDARYPPPPYMDPYDFYPPSMPYQN